MHRIRVEHGMSADGCDGCSGMMWDGIRCTVRPLKYTNEIMKTSKPDK